MPSKSQIEKTMRRDGFTCRCCGFQSNKYQRVVPYDQQEVQGADPFITVCTFCERCLMLEQAGLMGSGILVWMPELTQAELNQVVRALYVARMSEDDLSKAASCAIDVLIARKAEAKKRLGTDDPLILATAFREVVDDTSYADRSARMEGIRLMLYDRYLVRQRAGDVDVFPQMMAYWTSLEGPFGQKPVSEWAALFEGIEAKLSV